MSYKPRSLLSISLWTPSLRQDNVTISERELQVTKNKYAEMDSVAWGSVLWEKQCVIILQVSMHIIYSLINTALCVFASTSLLPWAMWVCQRNKEEYQGTFCLHAKGIPVLKWQGLLIISNIYIYIYRKLLIISQLSHTILVSYRNSDFV